ncbi:MAG: thiol-disulfide oxidoreductase DCC family protein [Flavobacteriaceae bacterium]
MVNKIPQHKKIILFDGVCNLCNSSVNYVIDHDHNDEFRFLPLQSELGKELQSYLGITSNSLDSIILYIPNEAYYVKSSAALKIMSRFKGVWKLAWIFNIIPQKIRDYVYDFVAQNRYQWYGKQDNCRIPTPELQSKFLS